MLLASSEPVSARDCASFLINNYDKSLDLGYGEVEVVGYDGIP
jgi:hypothetical protein